MYVNEWPMTNGIYDQMKFPYLYGTKNYVVQHVKLNWEKEIKGRIKFRYDTQAKYK